VIFFCKSPGDDRAVCALRRSFLSSAIIGAQDRLEVVEGIPALSLSISWAQLASASNKSKARLNLADRARDGSCRRGLLTFKWRHKESDGKVSHL
jgi:hypothetical protein